MSGKPGGRREKQPWSRNRIILTVLGVAVVAVTAIMMLTEHTGSGAAPVPAATVTAAPEAGGGN